MFWLDPFFWLFIGMVALDAGILLYGFIRVRLFLQANKTQPLVQQVAQTSLRDRLREYQNRPIGTGNHSE